MTATETGEVLTDVTEERPSRYLLDREGVLGPLLLLPAVVYLLALVAFGCALGSRVARLLGAAGLAALGLLGLDVARSRIVPGANDNASGVAALLAITTAFARDPLERTDVIALFTDCEETGLGGSSRRSRMSGVSNRSGCATC